MRRGSRTNPPAPAAMPGLNFREREGRAFLDNDEIEGQAELESSP